ncbi:hypothetical protein GGQ74_001891 [Desulfobaculum xiamenense]|uniref:DUF2065 domain-containing protein n=1 Tax=Desulfobaculum xiamenense TaxID=995050 RepID=A0A846QJ04_9BACT|nr:DUF2065 domain-containing protein [Desulfobaculum xiamenense]NJB68218.1 hypothetical protein [Desulfobaculum xiamenense]
MQFDWKLFTAAIGLAFVFEGVFYALAANHMQRILRALADRPPSELRTLGLTAAILGLLLVWFARS